MKVRQMMPIIVAGVVGAGAAVCSHLKISRQKEVIAAQERTLEEYQSVIAVRDMALEESSKYIEELKQLIVKNEEKPSPQEPKPVVYQKNQGEKVQQANSAKPTAGQRSTGKSAGKLAGEKSGQEYIFQYDKKLNLVGQYKSASDACRGVGLKSDGSIYGAISGKEHTAGGYFWSRGTRPLKKFPDKWVELSQSSKNSK